MKYSEEVRDLFAVPNEYYLAHCISADFGMGAGIVVKFNKLFNMKQKLMSKYPDFIDKWDYQSTLCNNNGQCILEDRVFNLITKRNYWLKPTYDTLTAALLCMKSIAIEKNITKIAMPLIGCGLDKLEWSKVSEIIKEVFKDTDIEILVCKLN